MSNPFDNDFLSDDEAHEMDLTIEASLPPVGSFSMDEVYFSTTVDITREETLRARNHERHEAGDHLAHVMERASGWVGDCA